jgi:hypothetical protein
VTIDGEGKLTWLPQGAADDDTKDFYSQYAGEMKDGRPNGSGSLSLHSGTTYTGSWRDGLMDGRGVLKLENGDDYEGDFTAGQMNGQGRYGSTDGTVYVGGFKNGLRDGTGTLTLADGTEYRTTWRDGNETGREAIASSDPVKPAAPAPQATPGGRPASSLSLRLLVDRKKVQDVLHEDASFQDYVTYDATNMPGSLKVEPAAKEITGVWKGNEIIQERPTAVALLDFQMVDQFPPVFLLAEITNQGNQTTRIKRAYLDIEQSATDLEPFLEIMGGNQTFCQDTSNNDGHFDATVAFTNFGWGPVRNAQLIYSFNNTTSAQMPQFTAKVGTFDKTANTSVTDGLRKLGLDVDKVSKTKFACKSESEVPACLDHVKATGILGTLADRVFNVGYQVRTKMVGHIDYDWVDSDGKDNNRSSPVAIDIPLFFFGTIGPECGGPAPVDHLPTVRLALDRKAYRIPVEWSGDLAQGDNRRLGLSLIAPKSSQHTFRLVLELADGTTLASQQVNLTYFKPRL